MRERERKVSRVEWREGGACLVGGEREAEVERECGRWLSLQLSSLNSSSSERRVE